VRFELQLFTAILPEFIPVFFFILLYLTFYAFLGTLVFRCVVLLLLLLLLLVVAVAAAVAVAVLSIVS
jgi:hypothetical protein